MLDPPGDPSVTVLSAAAGCGKTVLLTEWARRRGAATTAWVSLDGDDNDRCRFWSCLLAALSACDAVPPGSGLRSLAVPTAPGEYPRFLAEVVNTLHDLPSTVWLVLDDLHEITDPQSLHGLATLLRHEPAALRLVLSTRYDPPLPLARLRLTGKVREIRAEDLRFTTAEARALLHTAGIQLAADQLSHLLEQLEGWSAGLRLAALSLAETEDPARHVTDFAANSWAVADYLLEEVLSQLSPALCEFATTISVCDDVSVDLATELSGRDDAGTLLDELTRRSSLVARRATAPHRYHTHALLRSFLTTELGRQSPERAAQLHGIAARWFDRHHEPVTALGHAGQSRDRELATDLTRRHAVDLVLSGDHGAVASILDVLGARRLAEDSQLSLVAGLLHLERGEADAADLALAAADTAWPPSPDTDLVVLRELVHARRAQITGDIRTLVDIVTRLKDRTVGRPSLRSLAMFEVGGALLVTHDQDLAWRRLRGALGHAREHGHEYVAVQCLTTLSELAAEEGDYGRMIAVATEADECNTRQGWERTVGGTLTSVLLSYGALLRADPATCLHHAERVSPLVRGTEAPVNRGLVPLVETLRGAAEFELGSWVAGARRIHTAQAGIGVDGVSPHQVALCASLGHRTAMMLGWSKAAGQVVDWAQAALPDAGEVDLMRARAQLAIGRHPVAGKIVKPLLDGEATLVLPWSIIETWLLAAEVAAYAEDTSGTRRALRQALTHAETLDVLFPVVFASVPAMDLVVANLGSFGPADGFARRALVIRRAMRVTPMPAPLTPSEREILHLLPTLRSFDEIAEDLMVSPNTVKTHVRSVYAKLGVSRRRDAVDVALRRGLLDSGHSIAQ